ncbi:MAG: DUF4234 domain-containing protein [Porcipelethomonas sp.]
MIQEKNIALYVVLSIVTCGIFGIYWEVCVVNDLKVASDRPADQSGGMVVILSIVTCGIYGIYWAYTAGEKVQAAQAKHGLPSDQNQAVIYLILSLLGFGIITFCLIQNELNKIARTNV